MTDENRRVAEAMVQLVLVAVGFFCCGWCLAVIVGMGR